MTGVGVGGTVRLTKGFHTLFIIILGHFLQSSVMWRDGGTVRLTKGFLTLFTIILGHFHHTLTVLAVRWGLCSYWPRSSSGCVGREVYRIVTSHTGPGVHYTGSVVLHIGCLGEEAWVVIVKLGEECYLCWVSYSAHQLFWGRGMLQSSWVKNVICAGSVILHIVVLRKRDVTVKLGEECYLSRGYHHAGSVVLDIICFGGGGALSCWLGSSPASLTPSMPWCCLKTDNKSAKFGALNCFCLLFHTGVWKDFHQNT